MSIKEFCTTDGIGIKNERFEMDAEGIISTTAEICQVGWQFDGRGNGMCEKYERKLYGQNRISGWECDISEEGEKEE